MISLPWWILKYTEFWSQNEFVTWLTDLNKFLICSEALYHNIQKGSYRCNHSRNNYILQVIWNNFMIWFSILSTSAWTRTFFIEFEFHRALQPRVWTHIDFNFGSIFKTSFQSFIEFEFPLNKNHRVRDRSLNLNA